MKTCLVVDDSKVIRMVARKILEELNFAVVEAEDGKIALDTCKASMPDGVLLDWNMPVMDGIEFLNELRALPGGDNVAVVLLHDRERSEAYPGCARRRGERIHHEALRQRNHPDEIFPSRPDLIALRRLSREHE